MIELIRDNFYKVLSLINAVLFNNYFARMVLEKGIEGRVFVDNEVSPCVCLVIHKYGMAMLSGRHDIDTFNHKLSSFLKDDAVNKGYAKWVLVHPETEWKNKISELLGDILVVREDIRENEISDYKKDGKVLQTLRANFKFNANRYVKKYTLPDGFRLEKIDSIIYSKISGSVIPSHYWRDAEDFLTNGAGYAILTENGDIVSICFTSFTLDDKYELGIETIPEFRGKGYGIYPVYAMIDFCLANKFEPVWGCRKENIPSAKLAEKAGFLPSSFHSYYTLPVL